jgi:hypothetical protein
VRQWVLLLYKVPPEPTARRVSVWRKLKRLGALLLQNAVWVLPATPATLEQFQWLATEIEEEMEGSAMVWETTLHLDGYDSALVSRFAAQSEEGYRGTLEALELPDADPAALSKRYQQLQAQDYFHVALGTQVRAALAASTSPVKEGEDEA